MIDVRQWRRWTFFFKVIGVNSITIYLGQMIVNFGYTSKFFFGGRGLQTPARGGRGRARHRLHRLLLAAALVPRPAEDLPQGVTLRRADFRPAPPPSGRCTGPDRGPFRIKRAARRAFSCRRRLRPPFENNLSKNNKIYLFFGFHCVYLQRRTRNERFHYGNRMRHPHPDSSAARRRFRRAYRREAPVLRGGRQFFAAGADRAARLRGRSAGRPGCIRYKPMNHNHLK